jgi:copper transport protein
MGRYRSLARRWVVALLGLSLLIWGLPGSVHATENIRLQESQPGNDAVLDATPEEIRLRFNSEVDARWSELLILDESGAPLETGQVQSGDTQRELVLPLDVALADGVYTVQWRARPDAEGASAAGFFTFQIGGQTGALAAMPPEVVFDASPAWVTILGNWLQILGTSIAAGIVLAWILLIRPLLTDRRSGRWFRNIALLGIGAALTGIGLHIITGISDTQSLRDLGLATDNGPGWILLLGHLLLLSAVILTPALWRNTRGFRLRILGAIIAAATLIPLAMTGALSGEHFGYLAALTSEWLRLLAMSAGLGWAIALGVLLRFRVPRDHGEAFARIISRSITGGIALIGIFILTSLYLADLTVGRSLSGLQTQYGYLLLAGIIAGLIGLLLGALALAGLNRSAPPMSSNRGVSALLALAPLLIASAFLAEAALSDLPTAREQVLAQQERVTVEVQGDTHQAAIHIAPGIVGANRITADIVGRDGTQVTDATQALVRVSQPDTLEGTRDILLAPLAVCTADGEVLETDIARFDSTDAVLGIIGQWRFDLIIHDLELGTIEESFELGISDQPRVSALPPPPLRFSGLQAAIGLITGALVIVLGAGLIRNRNHGAELAPQKLVLFALAVFTVLALWQGRISHTPDAHAWNPIPRTVESVQLGEAVYQTHCATCHGADATGAGELADELGRRPSDLTDSHMDTHPAGDIAWWIREGIDPAMPGFGDVIDDEETWHLLNYLRSLRHPIDDQQQP